MTGFIHMLRSDNPQKPNSHEYTVMFAPIGPTGTGGVVKGKQLANSDRLVALLKSAHIDDININRALGDLRLKGNASIAYVELSDAQLRTLDLI